MKEQEYSYGGGYSSYNDGGSYSSGYGGYGGSTYYSSSSFSGPSTKSGAPDMRFSSNRSAAGLGTRNVGGAPDMRFSCNKK